MCKMRYEKSVLLLAIVCYLLGGCTTENVKGAYPNTLGGGIEGASVGAVVGATAGGLMIANGSASLGALAGAMIGAPIGSYYDSEGAIFALQKHGVTVARMGDVVEIIIPSDLLFDGNDTEIHLEAYPMMDKITTLLKQYGNSSMSVVAYSDDIGSVFSQLELTRFQAQSVTTYLWSHGVNLQRMDFYGMGHEETAASDLSVTGSAYNRRIEITSWSENIPGPLNAALAKTTEDCWTKDDPVACTNARTGWPESYFGQWQDP